MAVSTNAKAFLACPVTQTVVNDIYSGRVVFSVAGNHSILADNYKPRAIELYNPHNAPFLNHYRWLLFFTLESIIFPTKISGSVFRNMGLILSFSISLCSYSLLCYAFSVSVSSRSEILVLRISQTRTRRDLHPGKSLLLSSPAPSLWKNILRPMSMGG